MSGPGQRQEAIQLMEAVGEEGEDLLSPETACGLVAVDYLRWPIGKKKEK